MATVRSKSRPAIRPLSVAILLASAPAIVAAQEESLYRCTLGNEVRRIEVVRLDDAPLPCSVAYHKDTENPGADAEELWNAINEPGYCEARAAEFVERLESWGWQCESEVAARNETD